MMNFTIAKADDNDLNIIFQLFEEAIQYQKTKNYVGWNHIDQDFIKEDVRKGLLLKVLNEENVIGIFSICYSDHLIWREKEKADAIYLHRIVLNRQFQGIKIFKAVLDWAIKHARTEKLKYVRMDTWAQNQKIIYYYESYGFKLLETYTTANTEKLPVQHRNLNVALLEMTVL